MRCPNCHEDEWRQAPSPTINIIECGICKNVYALNVELTYWQLEVLYSKNKHIALLGAVGTGKTFISSVKAVLIATQVSDNSGIFIAQTLAQLEEVTFKAIITMIPEQMIKSRPKKLGGKAGEIILKNNHALLFRARDSDSLLSIDICHFHIEEASGVPYKTYHDLTSRIRTISKTSGFFYSSKERNKNLQLANEMQHSTINSNPSDSWIIDEVMVRAKTRHNYTSIPLPELDENNVSSSTEVFVTPTEINPFLPPSYIEGLYDKYRSRDERATYIEGNFNIKAGRIISNVNKLLYKDDGYICNRMSSSVCLGGLDFGAGQDSKAKKSGDPQAFVLVTVAMIKDVLVIYCEDEYFEEDICSLENRIFNIRSVIERAKPINFYTIYGDSIHGNKRAENYSDNISSIFDIYNDNGLKVEPSKSTGIKIKERNSIFKSMNENNRIFINRRCVNLISELREYKDDTIKNNHAIDAFMDVVMEMPPLVTKEHEQFFNNMLTQCVDYATVITGEYEIPEEDIEEEIDYYKNFYL